MRHVVIVLAAVSCLSLSALGQTAEELVNKNIQAKGGMEKIKAIGAVPSITATSSVWHASGIAERSLIRIFH